jgi:hypothetical protein
MDWQSIAKQVMGNYDSTWMDAIKKKRSAKSTQAQPGAGEETPAEEAAEGAPHAEPDGDEGMDEETKAKLLQMLSE